MIARYTRVWDALVRIAHWSLLLSVTLAWLSTVIFGWTEIHQPSGYAAMAIVTLRIGWGFVGSHYARFRQFVRGPAQMWRYAALAVRSKAPRYVGHNPLGGWMVVVLLTAILLTGFTGWLFTTDAFWGVPWVHHLHNVFAWAVLCLVVLHVFGVVYTSRAHRENLVRAMLTGYKPALGSDDVQ